MIIGTHELRGTIIELQQPFICLQKHIQPSSSLSSSLLLPNDDNNDGVDSIVQNHNDSPVRLSTV